jgi:hypothetical protein
MPLARQLRRHTLLAVTGGWFCSAARRARMHDPRRTCAACPEDMDAAIIRTMLKNVTIPLQKHGVNGAIRETSWRRPSGRSMENLHGMARCTDQICHVAGHVWYFKVEGPMQWLSLCASQACSHTSITP